MPMIATVTLNPSLDEWITLNQLKPGQLNRARNFARFAGGKGLNVSRVVAELGGRTVAYMLCGGPDGEMLKHLVEAEGLNYSAIETQGTTRNNYKIQTIHPQGMTEINGAGPKVGPSLLSALKQRILTDRPRPKALVLAGSLPPGPKPSLYATWVRIFRRALKVPIVLDASEKSLNAGLAAKPWLIKPNQDEAESLLGRTLKSRKRQKEAVGELIGLGAQHVVLSLGAEGAIFGGQESDTYWYVRPPEVKAKSAVGAGDSFVAGFMHRYLETRDFSEALRFGAVCGSACAMTAGTELVRRKDVLRLLKRAQLSQI